VTERGTERPCTGSHGCTRPEPHTHRYLSMADRVFRPEDGDTISNRLAVAQAIQRLEAELGDPETEN
jgi:hypothetical protein